MKHGLKNVRLLAATLGLLAAVAVTLALGGLAGSTARAAGLQQQPPAPPTLPSAPPAVTPPRGPAPPPTASAIPTLAPPVAPPTVDTLPGAPPTAPDPVIWPTATLRPPTPAFVTVVLRPDGQPARRGTLLSLQIVATNRGAGLAEDTLITLGLDPARVRVVATGFSREGAWVSSHSPASLELRTGPLASRGDTLTATLRLAVLTDAPDGGDLVERLRFRWSDRAGDGQGRSNKVDLAVGGPAPVSLGQPEQISGGALEGDRTFASAIFAPGEPVALWHQATGGLASAAGTIVADAEGRISVPLDTPALGSGTYIMVAYGHWTELQALAPFTVP